MLPVANLRSKASGGDHDPSRCGKEECQCIFKSGSEDERNGRSGTSTGTGCKNKGTIMTHEYYESRGLTMKNSATMSCF